MSVCRYSGRPGPSPRCRSLHDTCMNFLGSGLPRSVTRSVQSRYSTQYSVQQSPCLQLCLDVGAHAQSRSLGSFFPAARMQSPSSIVPESHQRGFFLLVSPEWLIFIIYLAMLASRLRSGVQRMHREQPSVRTIAACCPATCYLLLLTRKQKTLPRKVPEHGP